MGNTRAVRYAASLTILALAGCSTAVDRALNELAFAEKNGTADDICEAHRKLAAAWWERRDAEQYKNAKVTADIYCQSAQLEKLR